MKMPKRVKIVNVPVIKAPMKTVTLPDLELFARVKGYPEIIGSLEKFLNKSLRKLPPSAKEEFLDVFWDAVDKGVEDFITLKALNAIFNPYRETAKFVPTEARSDSRIKDLEPWLRKLKNVKDYLDVGCSEANITKIMGDALQLGVGNVHGCDIQFPEKSVQDPSIIFSHNIPNKLPYKDESFDLVTAMMALHHFSKPKEMLQEIYRVLRPGGTFIIREHDTGNVGFKLFLDLVHALYAVVINEEESAEAFLTTFYSTYNTKETWSKKYIEPVGLKFSGLLRPIVDKRQKKRGQDLYRSYYAKYKK